MIRRSMAPAALLLLAAMLAAPVSAAEPEDVVYDVTVAVRFVDADAAATPLAGATIALRARVTDFPEEPPLVQLHATTDAEGVAVFTEVPRGGPGGPTVHLSIDAQAERHTVDDELCRTTETWSGSAVDVLSPPAEPIVVTASSGASGLICRWLAGRIVDGDGDPHPADAQLSRVTIAQPGGGETMTFPLAVGADGSFRQSLPVWGTAESPAFVRLDYVSTATRTTEGGCEQSVAEAVTWEGPLALEVEDPAVLELVSGPAGGDACGAVATARPNAPTAPTLPPTDVRTDVRVAAATPVALAAVGVVMVALGLLAFGTARRRRAGR
jgi:hypothetical protein